MTRSLPSVKESYICAGALCLWLLVTALCVGFRPEHVVMAVLIFALFFFNGVTRRLVIALVPFFLFGISYDWMNILPNYEVNPVDVAGLYNTEKSLFGITVAQAEVLTPNEFFAIHHAPFMDFLAGIFYLCWVPLPIVYGLYLYFSGRRGAYLHFAIAFLLVNLLGFGLYYVHPAAPPWYVALHGFEAVPGTPGDVAGLGRWDDMTGLGIFNALYARNSNVFAAMPSLHSAYTLIAFVYSLRSRSPLGWRIALGVVTLGIWFTAVYTSHHYILDVLGGIATALVGIAIFEYGLMKIPAVARFMDRYTNYITK
ncbi:MAG: inositol phosphorylceramide synthase [Bacteroidales bacterium]|nr:inositol phosphorylceramide synthase [Bacteroidales bacterium]